MTLQDFKDQVGREHKDEYGVPFKDWAHFKYIHGRKDIEIAHDRAAELYAKAREKEKYKEGYRMGWDNRGMPEFLHPTLTPYPDGYYPIGGYAPGSYMCKCSTCGCEFFGDKRAFQCLPCASGLSSASRESNPSKP